MPPGNPSRPRRVLGLSDLVVYGIVLIQPVAPVGIYGIATRMSHGHVVTTILLAMVAMTLTAASYGRLAGLYPSAGSAYTYVGRGFGPHAGFLVGWSMFLDYLIIPIINIIYGALTLERLAPAIPYRVWALLFAALITGLNLRGVRSMARANAALLAAMTVVIGGFVMLSLRYLVGAQGWGAVISTAPVYNPATFDLASVMTATSLAALTYIGFDGVTTLAEEVKNPRRTVPLATVLVCIVTGIFSTVEVYLAERAWPDYNSFPNVETAFMDVTQRVGGDLLFQAMAAVMIVACFGSGLSGQAGAARLLYGMGRDDILSKRFFGRFNARHNQPSANVVIVGLVAFAGALTIPYDRAAALLNFGAFLAFMGVNLAAIREFGLRQAAGHRRNVWLDFVAPGLGFLFCLGIWFSLPLLAKVFGGLWLLAGIGNLVVKTRGFRVQPKMMDFSAG